MDEGDTAVRVAVNSHFTPSIDEADDNTAGDENAVYFEKVHTGLLGVRGTDSAVFLTGVLLWSTIPIVGGRRMPAESLQESSDEIELVPPHALSVFTGGF